MDGDEGGGAGAEGVLFGRVGALDGALGVKLGLRQVALQGADQREVAGDLIDHTGVAVLLAGAAPRRRPARAAAQWPRKPCAHNAAVHVQTYQRRLKDSS